MTVYRRVLLLALATSLLTVAALMDRGYVTVTARVEVLDLRDLEAGLLSDFEDALEIVGSTKSWMTEWEAWDAVKVRAEILGWTYDNEGWMKGRQFYVLAEWKDARMDIVYIYMERGQLLASMRDPGLSVCGGQVLHPFPTLTVTIAQFNARHCRDLDRLYVMAAHRVLCAWFDAC